MMRTDTGLRAGACGSIIERRNYDAVYRAVGRLADRILSGGVHEAIEDDQDGE